MCGSIYVALYLAALLGAFPASTMDCEVLSDAPEAAASHSRLLAWAQQAASPAFSFLSLEQTSCFRLVVNFEGLRICFHSLWDVMASYIQKRLSTARPLNGNDMLEFLHGETTSIYMDLLRDADELRSDGQTSLIGIFDMVIDNETSKVIALDMVKCDVLACPQLDDL